MHEVTSTNQQRQPKTPVYSPVLEFTAAEPRVSAIALVLPAIQQAPGAA